MVNREGEEEILSPGSRLLLSQVGEKVFLKMGQRQVCRFSGLGGGQVSVKTKVAGRFCEDTEIAGDFVLHLMGLGGCIVNTCSDLGARLMWIQAWHLAFEDFLSSSMKWVCLLGKYLMRASSLLVRCRLKEVKVTSRCH